MSREPRACFLLGKPTDRSCEFAGVYISLRAIAQRQRLDQSVVSRIFSGKRRASLDQARAISKALEMTLDDFVKALEAHRQTTPHPIRRAPRRRAVA